MAVDASALGRNGIDQVGVAVIDDVNEIRSARGIAAPRCKRGDAGSGAGRFPRVARTREEGAEL